MSEWWEEFLSEDVNLESFSTEVSELMKTYQLNQDQQRMFQSIKTGRNLFLSDDLTDEDIIWNIGVVGVNGKHRGDFKFYRKTVIERLRQFEEAEKRYQWHSGKWSPEAMRVLIGQWTVGAMVVVPHNESLDNGSPMIYTKEWYEHMPLRKDLPEDFWSFRASVVYALMARSICKSYPMATQKGLVSLADMTDFDWDKYDMDQKMRHSDIQAVIPNKLRRMISINPDDRMKEQLQDFGNLAKKYGFVMYDTLEEAEIGEAGVLPPKEQIPTWVGGSLQVDIKDCLKHLFRCEPDALKLMEEVYADMEAKNEILHPEFMQKAP